MLYTIYISRTIVYRTFHAVSTMSHLCTGCPYHRHFGCYRSPIIFSPSVVTSVHRTRATIWMIASNNVFHLTLAKHIVCLSQRNFT